MDETKPEKTEFRNLIELFNWMKETGVEEGSPLWQKNYNLFLAMKARSYDVPETGIFELTPRCNLDCKMCYVHLTPKQMGNRKELHGNQIISILNQAVDLGMMNVQLTGGEAMLHPDFKQIYLHCLSKGLRVSLLTNGLLLTEEKIDFFKANPPASLQITLYGWDDNSYEMVTGFGVYHKIVENVLKAKTINCKLTITITPSKYCKKHEVNKIVDFCKKHELDFKVNRDLQMPNQDTQRDLANFDLTEEEFFEIRHLFKTLEAVPEADIPKEGQSDKKYYGTKCAAGRAMFCLTWNGILKPCLDLPIGMNSTDVDFKTAWIEINKQVKTLQIPSECHDCIYSSICNQCPAAHAQGAVSGHVDRRICTRTKRMVAEGLLKLPEGRITK